MSLIGRLLDVRPDALSLARSVADEPGFVFLWSSDGTGPSFLACRPVERREALDPEPELAVRRGPNELWRAPRWVGIIPYECRRTLERPRWTRQGESRAAPHVSAPVWHRYGAVAVVTDRVLVVGDEPDEVRTLCRLLGRAGNARAVRLTLGRSQEPEAEHARRIRRAIEWIHEGELYQVNLARRLSFFASGRAVDLLALLAWAAPAPFAAAAQWDGLTLVSTSPELLLRTDVEGNARTAPIKGTRPRGRYADEDHALVIDLDSDEKERAELSMVVDVERNDLGRVAIPGTVRVLGAPRVMTKGPVHHRVSVVGARLRPEVSREELFRAMVPSGSVTGAPKVRAMEVIATLESERRGLYTGGFGLLRHDGSVELAMAIRTLTIVGGEGHYFSGGGIVADSDPDREVAETRWKALALSRAGHPP